MDNILEVCKMASVEAGKAVMEIYNAAGKLEVSYKEGGSPLTSADKKANDIIVKALREAYPAYAVLSEEEKDEVKRLDNPYCFIVDPLDGTKEFIKRNGQFTVNIALACHGEAVRGVIYVPATEELYYAGKGMGAFLEYQGKTKKLEVSSRTENLRVVMSSSHGCPEMDALIEKYQLKDFVKMGSSLKGCLIAKGEAEIYYRYNPTMEWDTAAMQCIVEEAGAIFRQMDDSEMRYNRADNVNGKGFYIINKWSNKL